MKLTDGPGSRWRLLPFLFIHYAFLFLHTLLTFLFPNHTNALYILTCTTSVYFKSSRQVSKYKCIRLNNSNRNGHEIHIVSLNVRGLGDNTKRRQVLHWFENKNSKIVLLQETHSTTHTERLWKNEWNGDMYFSHGTGAPKGVVISFKQNVHKTIHKCITDKEGRYVVLDIEVDDIRCTLVNLYAPNEDEPEFFIELVQTIEALPNDHRIDFNLVLDLDMDKYGGRKTTNINFQTLIKNWMAETDLEDIWQMQHPDDKIYTWHRTRPSNIFCRV